MGCSKTSGSDEYTWSIAYCLLSSSEAGYNRLYDFPSNRPVTNDIRKFSISDRQRQTAAAVPCFLPYMIETRIWDPIAPRRRNSLVLSLKAIDSLSKLDDSDRPDRINKT